jgi:hypothetical protein
MTGYVTPAQIDSVGDDDISQILGLSTNASQQNKLELQQRLANALRLKEGAKGQSVPMGSVFLPPNPLETAMNTFDHLQGIVSGMQGKKQGDQLDADRQKGLERFARLWFKNKQQGMQDPNDPNAQQGPPSPQDTGDPSDQML